MGVSDVQASRTLAATAHRGQVDKAGRPYIGHPERVAEHLLNPTAQESVVAWLHDVVEDTDVTLQQVQEAFGSQVAAAVDAISRRTGETRGDYYARVRVNPIALTVKAADLADNTDPARLQLLPHQEQAELEAKYAHARRQLGIR